MVEQIVIPLHHDEARDKKAKDALTEILGIFKVAAANEKTIPYIAALGYGLITGWMTEENWEGSVRMGLEAVIFTHLASMQDNFPAQTFGCAGLASIGLTLPVKAAIQALAPLIEAKKEAIEEAQRISKAPMEDKPYYTEWVMAQITGSTMLNYCEWVKQQYGLEPAICIRG